MTANTLQSALVLSGGGAYGAFEVGVMKVLFAGRSPANNYAPLMANILSGSSGGAFNAAVITGMSQTSELDAALHLEDIWLHHIADRSLGNGNGVFRLVGDFTDYLNGALSSGLNGRLTTIARDGLSIGTYLLGRASDFAASRLSLSERLISLINLASFVDVSPFRNLLNDVVIERDIHDSSYRLTIVTSNWLTGREIQFTNGDFKNGRGILAIMAAAAIPGIFPPVRIGSELCVDGGVVDNTPLKIAVRSGAVSLHVISLDPKPRYVPLAGAPNTINSFLRAYNIMLANKLNEDITTARWINDGLRAITTLQQQANNGAPRDVRDAVRVVGQMLAGNVSYRPITIHRYFPETSLGGDLGMLDFNADTIRKMISEGERVAMLHDCAKSGCLLTGES